MDSIQLHQISAGYDVPVLHNVDLTIPRGSLVGILGPNGAGKTTLLRIMTGLLIPFSGKLSVFSRPIISRQDRYWLRKQTGLVSQIQAPSQLPISVEDTVLLGRWGRFFQWWRKPSAADHAAVQATLAQIGMEKFAKRDWRTLSGGQRQRAALARALVRQPQILLMDEPTTYLDAQAQDGLIELIHGLQSELDLTIIIVTHMPSSKWHFSHSWHIDQGLITRCA